MPYDPNDKETQEAIKKAVEEALDKEVTGLKSKNNELLAQIKKLKAGQEVSPEEYARVERELEEMTAKLTDAEKKLKAASAEIEKQKKLYEAENKIAHQLLVDNGLTEALLKAGVKPEFQKAAKALLAGQVTLVAEGDTKVAKVGDKALGDFVSEWAKGDEGKHFVAASTNSGGGSPGPGGGEPPKKTMTRAAFDAMTDEAAKMAFFKEGGKLTD